MQEDKKEDNITKHPKLIVSMASYPKRFNYCKRTLDSILHQTIIELVDTIYINIDDNLSSEDVAKYESLKKYSPIAALKGRS